MTRITTPERAGRRLRPLALPLAAALSTALILSPLAGGADATKDTPRGAAELQPFKQQLMGALLQGMQAGPGKAVEACNLQAPEIAAALSTEGVRVGRTSHRLRNPDNAGPDWATAVLNDYLADPGARAPRTVALDDGREGYVEPILTQPLCLACHGSGLSEPVAETLAELYPEDQATGFDTGDLRGVFWVSYPADG